MATIAERIAADQKMRAELEKKAAVQCEVRAEANALLQDQQMTAALIDQANNIIGREYDKGNRMIEFKLIDGSLNARTMALKSICKQYLPAGATVYNTYYYEKFGEQITEKVNPDFHDFPVKGNHYYKATDFIIEFKHK